MNKHAGKDIRDLIALKIAAEQGDAEAQSKIGEMFFNGAGGQPDYAKAVEWYQKAADQGHAKAQCFLGMAYYFGEIMPQDKIKGLQWFKKAADQGNKQAIDAYNKLSMAMGLNNTSKKLNEIYEIEKKKLERKKDNRCFIASAIYGPSALETNILREWRDSYLLTSLPGRLLVNFYYFVSPSLSKFIIRYEMLKKATRFLLDAFIANISR